METETHLKMASIEDCDCCQIAPDEMGHLYGCEERKAVFTLREQEVLRRIRETSMRAREIKETLRDLELAGVGDSLAKHGALAELEELRRTRADLEKERIAAAEERMRFLGHL